MPRYALFLRGVNVGGRASLSMADLRGVLESLGHTGVSTYLQSGNAVVTSQDTDPSRVARQAAERLTERVGRPIDIVVRTAAELAAVVAANPYPEAAADRPKLLHVLFLSGPVDAADLAGLDAPAYAPDEFQLGDRVVYQNFPESYGRSRLPTALGRQLARARPELVATDRNWNTVRALAERTAG
jgi:uncharacterized protein (DUF1697 family)